MPVHVATYILEMKQQEVTAFDHQEPQVCAMDDHMPTTSRRFVQFAAACFLSLKKNRRMNHLDRRSKN